MGGRRGLIVWVVAVAGAVAGCADAPRAARLDANPAMPGFDARGSDAAAVALADSVMARMGGRAAWDATRYVSFDFFGRRRHAWDRYTGDARVDGRTEEGEPYVVLLNVQRRDGRAWRSGAPIEDPAALATMLDGAYRAWVNDTYWLLMPYKLKDPGVTLRHLGARPMEDGRAADVLELTFAGVGVTPENKYHVYVARDTGLVEQWDFYASAADAEPRFRIPWRDWRRHGRILLTGDRGDGRTLGAIAVPDALPASAFTDPGPVTLD